MPPTSTTLHVNDWEETTTMRTIKIQSTCAAAIVAVLAMVLIPVGASAGTPNPTSAVINERIFNDCGTSTLTTVNTYPALISITDEENCDPPFANLHNWRFSENGMDAVDFDNDASFRFGCDVMISGTGEGEAGIGISPWWSQDVDGRFNVRTTDGEIACFGGRLPFYSFTASHGVNYVKGDVIYLEIVYTPNGLSEMNPATIEYIVDYNGMMYSSGALAFDEGNPDEDPPYGLWGILNEARAGGYVQVFLEPGSPDSALNVEWRSIDYENTAPVPVEKKSWGAIKSRFGD